MNESFTGREVNILGGYAVKNAKYRLVSLFLVKMFVEVHLVGTLSVHSCARVFGIEKASRTPSRPTN